jgi:hypothetical protein
MRMISVLDQTRVYHLWHPPAPSKPTQWHDGANVAYLQRSIRLTRCLRGLIEREPHDLTVRLAGESDNSPALAQLMRSHGWRLESDPSERADIELLALPGCGRFRGTGDCRVVAAFESGANLPWRARSAHVILSPTGLVGRGDQVRLRLGDVGGFWRTLSAVSARDGAARGRPQAIPVLAGA